MSEMTVEERYAGLQEQLVGEPGVDMGVGGTGRRAFGADALKVNNKIFALLSSRGQLVLKLPRARVDELVAAGMGERFDPGHGRVMKEWIALSPAGESRLEPLAREALDFVRGPRV